MNKSVLASVAVVAVVAIAGGAWFMNQPTAEETISIATEEVAEFDVVEMTLGNPDAPVQVVEYASYTCPHCANFHNGPYQQLKADYIDTGRIGFTYREVYFDQPGLWASMMARCGGEMRFFGISNLLYENQQTWARAGDGAAIAAALRNIGKVAGLSDADLDQCMSDAANAEELMAWYRTNADRDEVTGTPSFLINGEKVSNSNFMPALEAAVADAEG